MNLPNYFLADLPPEAALNAKMVSEAGQALRRNRERFLAGRRTQSLIGALAEVSKGWLKPGDPFREMALRLGPGATGFSEQTLAFGLDTLFGTLTASGMEAIVLQYLGHLERLDQVVASDSEEAGQRAAFARGPELLVHIAAGTLPNPVIVSMVVGLLARSAQFVKCASGTSLLPRLFAHSIYQSEPKLGACLEVAEWKGGTEDLESALFAEAQCVTVTGTDQTLADVRARIPAHVRTVGYAHRVSLGYVTRDVLTSFNAHQVAALAARDVAAWDQVGCLSPHAIYVESGGRVSPMEFAELLGAEMAALERIRPRGRLHPEQSAAIAARRSFYQVRAAHSPETRIWCSPDSTAWTVVYENEPSFVPSCLNRFVYVKSVESLTQALEGAASVSHQVSTVGLAASGSKTRSLALEFARWGASRICPLGQMQAPPLAWRHDGRPTLGDLIIWSDLETHFHEA